MFEIDNTRKHFLPQFYLRGFCRQDKKGKIPHIYVFDKKAPGKGIQSRSIERVEVSRDAYSVHIDDFNKQRESVWGDLFSRLEATSAMELNEIIADRNQSAPLRAWLADFATGISLRSRGLRERLKETSLKNWNSLRRETNKILEEMDNEALAQETRGLERGNQENSGSIHAYRRLRKVACGNDTTVPPKRRRAQQAP